MSFISLRLEGNASIWFDQLKPDVVLSYAEFKLAFLKQFQEESTSTYGAALRTLDHVKQETSERVSSYGIRFGKGLADLRRYTEVDDVTAIHKYARGLRAELKSRANWYIKKDEYLTVEDLGVKMTAREEHERDERRFRSPVNAVEPVVTKETRPLAPEWIKMIASMKAEIKELKGQVARGGQARTTTPVRRNPPQWTPEGIPICLNCNLPGHMVSQCPTKLAATTSGGITKGRPPVATRPKQWCNYHNRWGGHGSEACFKRPGRQWQPPQRPTAVMPKTGQQPPPPSPLPLQASGRGRGGPVKQGFQ